MRQIIDIGDSANDGGGDPLRDAFDKTNDNFADLYAAFNSLGVPISMMPNAQAIPFNFENVASGTVDLYTVPAGKRAIIVQANIFNTTGGSITFTPKLKTVGGTYQIYQAAAAITTLALGAITTLIVFEAGEKISITTTAQGLHVMGRIVIFDDTSPLKTVKNTALVAGDNLIYQVPLNKVAIQIGLSTSSTLNAGCLLYFNESGGARAAVPYTTQAGITVSSVNARSGAGSASVANNALFANLTTGSIAGHMAAQQAVVMTLDATGTGGGMAWVNVCELDA